MNKHLIAVSVLLATGALSASAGVVKTESYTSSNQAAYTVSNNDLIEGKVGVITAGSLSYDSNLGSLTNGLVGGENTTGDTALSDNGAWAVTYTLTSSPQGYNITGINTYTAWSDWRTNQNYTVTYTVVGNPTIQTLGTFANGTTASDGGSLRIALTDDGPGGILIAGANMLTFSFPVMPSNNGSAYREIDVVIPEPAMLGLLALGGCYLLRRRR